MTPPCKFDSHANLTLRANLSLVQNWPLVQKSLRANLTLRAILSSCNFDPAPKYKAFCQLKHIFHFSDGLGNKYSPQWHGLRNFSNLVGSLGDPIRRHANQKATLCTLHRSLSSWTRRCSSVYKIISKYVFLWKLLCLRLF